MSSFAQFLQQQVSVELSGRIQVLGILVDHGLDILVLYNGQEFLYIPVLQLQHIKLNLQDDSLANAKRPPLPPIEKENDKISLRKTLMNAKGMFVKIYVIGNQIIHGYLLSILNDYFVFYSPVYKTMFISLSHLKWLSPYTQNVTPYSLDSHHLPVSPAQLSLPRSFEEQLKKLEGNIVVFDIADHPGKTGLLKRVSNQTVHLITGEGEEVCWNLPHIKTVHVP